MRDLTPTLSQNRCFHDLPGYVDSSVVLYCPAALNTYFEVGGWDHTATGRIEFGGPEVAGPYLWVNGKTMVLAADPALGTGTELQRKRAEGLLWEVALGEEVLCWGQVWRIERASPWDRHNLKLTKVTHAA